MEAAGLVLGALGISGLFTACIQNFDIVVNSRNFGHEFDLLCTQLGLQRIRLVLWGESLGLVPGPSEKRIPYHTTIERDDIRPAIESTLNHLCLLLQNAEVVTGRYKLEDGMDGAQEIQPASSTGLTIFRERFESFKARIRKNQKAKSTWEVTRWAIHDSAKFKAMIGNIKDLMDGLESITSTLGVLERQQALLTEEVESISDTRSLRLLQEVASSHETSPSLKIVSGAASIRLSIAESSCLPESNQSKITGSSQSFYTAPSQKMEKSLLPVLGEDSSILNPTDDTSRPPLAWNNGGRTHWERLVAMAVGQQNHSDPTLEKPDPREGGSGDVLRQVELQPSAEGVPQNQRVISNLISKMPTALPQLKFDSGSLHYGEALAAVKQHDEEVWKEKSTTLVVSADKCVSAARRVFLELRSIRNAAVPFISAAPIGDDLDKVLASIEGPPDTPYEGGIFRIGVRFPDSPAEPPILRFQTRVYHPNIDPKGNICADYQQWWSDPTLQSYMFSIASRSGGSWFSESFSNRYSLGALLTALCGLLACPNVDDTLVPEIAATYINEYESYCGIARSYTIKYATADQLSGETVDFEESVSWAGLQTGSPAASTLMQDGPSDGSVPYNGSYHENTVDRDDASSVRTPRPMFVPSGEGEELNGSTEQLRVQKEGLEDRYRGLRKQAKSVENFKMLQEAKEKLSVKKQNFDNRRERLNRQINWNHEIQDKRNQELRAGWLNEKTGRLNRRVTEMEKEMEVLEEEMEVLEELREELERRERELIDPIL
ncbi:hypothetical protein FDECE_16392 [Fusarium decemcellulare]|nr:hypothetical protein FDECE_16392 [Fusarium decemcellulare]